MRFTNNANLPEPVVLALTHDDYSRGDSNRSVTQLIDSARAQILRVEHDDKVVEDASDRIWIALGKTMHFLFEVNANDLYKDILRLFAKCQEQEIAGSDYWTDDTWIALGKTFYGIYQKRGGSKYITEERLFAEVLGWNISGAIDIQYDEVTGTVTLKDYKCTSFWSVLFGKEEWVNQLNFYAWLVEKSKGVTVAKLKILVVMRDWRKADLERNKDYPPHPITEVDIPLWSKAKRDAYVEERVRIHQQAEFQRLTGDTLPLCTDAERWKNPAKYAVKKKGNKTAMKVCDSEQQAEEFIDGEKTKDLTKFDAWLVKAKKAEDAGKKAPVKPKPRAFIIEERPSVPTRCAKGWCPIADWCDQYQAELEEGSCRE